MAEGTIRIPPDGGGKTLRTVIVDDGEHQQVVTLADDEGTLVAQPLTNTQLRATPVPTFNQSGLVPESYDYISLTYTGDDLTGVVYKDGGSSGTVVATLTLVYAGGVLQSVGRS